MRWIIGSVAVLAGVLTTTAVAETVTVVPTKDNTIYQGVLFETNSCGAGSGFVAGNTTNGLSRRALIQFETATNCAVPPGSTVTDAAVTMTTDRSRAGSPFTMTLHRLLADWGEGPTNCDANPGQGAPAIPGEATWLHRFFSSTPWATPGGDYTVGASGTGLVGTSNGPYTFTGVGLAGDLQGWLSTPDTNFGWELIGDETANQTTSRFLSRETNTPPTLAITYAPPAGVEACCFGCAGVENDCTLATAADCTARGGVTQSGVTACTPTTCPQASGACCVAAEDTNYACQELTQAQCNSQGGSFKGANTRCNELNICGLAPWRDALPRPAVATPVSGTAGGAATYEIAMTRFQQQLHRDLLPTAVWGYGGSYPGPTIEASTGQPVEVRWVNDLRRDDGVLLPIHEFAVDRCAHGPDVWRDAPRTVVHLHGGHVPPRVDGLPEYAFLPGSFDTYLYPNGQQGTTLWYHDHSLGITRLNVYMGLAGFYVLRDDLERSLALPSGAYEVPLVIQDRNINLQNGELVYPAALQQMFHGDNIVVNGKVWPFLNVDQGKYRFRILNASTSRTFTLHIPDPRNPGQDLPLTVIGTEGGLYAAPRSATEITVAPAERFEVIVDFAGFARNTELILKNKAVTDFPVGMAPMGGTQNVLKFAVGRRTGFTGPVPSTLRSPFPSIDPATATVTRTFNLVRVAEPCAGGEWLIQSLDATGSVVGQHWDDLSDFPILGATEIWELKNNSTVMHPIHVHLVQFQVVNRQRLDAAGNPVGAILAPEPLEQNSWKDTVKANPGEVVRIIARFDDFVGRYPYHCHIIEHEDHEMMRQFQSRHDSAQCVVNGVCGPNEDCLSCPADCAVSSGAYCGNGVCEAGDGEICSTCPQDCPAVGGVCCGTAGTCDPACASNGFYCRDMPRVRACCGDSLCEGAEIGSVTCGDCNATAPPPLPPSCTAPDAPSGVTATAKKGIITVAWTPPTPTPTGGFRVYRTIGPSGTASFVDSEGPNANSFRDMTGAPGTQYCYTVKSWNDCDGDRSFGTGDTESTASNQACATP